MTKNLDLPRLLRRRLRAQADLFAALTLHPTLIGTGREEALIELLRQFMPRRFEILRGTVAILDADQRPTRSTHQVDIIIADTMDFPTLLRSGNSAVVPAQSVHAMLEVKSNLRRGASFISAVVQIARARQMLQSTRPVFTRLFSFGAPMNPETLRDWLTDVIALRRLLATGQGEPSIVRVRDTMLKSEDGSMGAVNETELLEILANRNLPDVIATDQGAVAYNACRSGSPDAYVLVSGRELPSIMILVDQLIERLGAESSSSVDDALNVVRAHMTFKLIPVSDLENPSLRETLPLHPDSRG